MSDVSGGTTSEAFRDGAEVPEPRNAFFAAPADDPRTRRPVDGVKLAVSMLVGLLAAWVYRSDGAVDQPVSFFFPGSLPGWLELLSGAIFIIAGLYAIGLIVGLLMLGSDRAAVVRDMAAAGCLAVVIAFGAGLIAGSSWPDLVPELFEPDSRPGYPVVRICFSVAVIAVARPYITLPMRQVGRQLVGGMIVAALLLSYGTLSSIIGAVAIGNAAAAAIHLIFGSGVGIPSTERVRAGLRRIGIDAVKLEFLEDQPIGASLVRARAADGGDVLVKIYGRDAADAALASRTWRSLWYRDANRALTASGLQQVEHESLLLLEGQRASAPVPELVGWGRSRSGDAIVATRWLDGSTLATTTDASEAVLASCWSALSNLHEVGIAHCQLDASNICIRDGGVILQNLSSAEVGPNETTVAIDRAQMLSATAAAADISTAITVARASIGDDSLLTSLPVLQSSAFPPALKRELKSAGISVKEIRSELAESLGVDDPELVQLVRVTGRNLLMAVLTFVAASALIGALAQIGLGAIVDQYADANWAFVTVALVLAQLTNVGEYISLTGLVQRPVPFGPTIMFRYALSFVSLAVPSEAGAISMNIRYMRKLGVPGAAAVAQGPLLTVVSKTIDIIFLILAGRVVGQTIDLDAIDGGPILRVVVLAVSLVVVGVIVTFSVPKLRAQVVPPLREGLRSVIGALTDGEKLTRLLLGTLMQRILFSMTLSASVLAFGGSASFAEIVFVNSAVGLFVGLVPVPGGIGVAEAAFVAALAAVGVPEETALAAAITHRMVTAYLPPVYGWFTTRWLIRNDYL